MIQTPVEWLASKINKAEFKFADATDCQRIIDQAKEMEIDKNKESYKKGYANGQIDAFNEAYFNL